MQYTRDKDNTIKLRCSEKEKEQIKLLATSAGLTMSAYILGECLGKNINKTVSKARKISKGG